MKYKNKYKLSEKQNIFLAKKLIAESVFCGMKLENRAVTFPETQTILNGINVPNVKLDDIQAILNMRDAWKHLLSSIQDPLSLEYICKLNYFVSRNESLDWGVLRYGSVGIGGTDYRPPVPVEKEVMKYLEDLLLSDISATDKAIEYFLWGCRSQLFWDGNKRTSLLVANKIMIMNGCGILTIPENHMSNFTSLLTEFYNTNEYSKVKEFLYNTSIEGIVFKEQILDNDYEI